MENDAVIRNIIFDWSGTLVNDFPFVLEATNSLFVHHGRKPFTVEEFRRKFYLPFAQFYKEYLPEVSLEQLEIHYHESFQELQEKIHPLPHALDILEYCKTRGIKIFLLSTIHSGHYERQSARLGLKGYFTQAYVRALDKREYIHRILQEHSLKVDETIFVGDMQHDIETAKHGGIRSCAVLTGYDTEEKLRAVHPDLIFENLEGLLQYLKKEAPQESPRPIPTVGALIFRKDGKMLLVRTHKWSNRWGIPGGKIQWGESSVIALGREIFEETGLRLTNISFEMVQDCVHPPEFYKPAHFILLNYVARTDGGEVKLNHEANDFRWVTAPEARGMDLNIPTRILLDHACPEKV